MFGSLISKSHSSNSFTGPVLGSVVLASLSPLELDRSQLQVPGKCMPPVAIVTHTSEALSVGLVSKSSDTLPCLSEAQRVCT